MCLSCRRPQTRIDANEEKTAVVAYKVIDRLVPEPLQLIPGESHVVTLENILFDGTRPRGPRGGYFFWLS